jgi:hypothetical protein
MTVLHRTKHLGWGTDMHLYCSAEALRVEFPRHLQHDGVRVLKRNRSNGGQGTWKVEPHRRLPGLGVLPFAERGHPNGCTPTTRSGAAALAKGY